MRHYASVASPTHSIIVGQKNKNKNNVGKPLSLITNFEAHLCRFPILELFYLNVSILNVPKLQLCKQETQVCVLECMSLRILNVGKKNIYIFLLSKQCNILNLDQINEYNSYYGEIIKKWKKERKKEGRKQGSLAQSYKKKMTLHGW